MDMWRVLEHGTSGFVRILEEYGSVSCDFSTTIRLISRSDFSFCDQSVIKGYNNIYSYGTNCTNSKIDQKLTVPVSASEKAEIETNFNSAWHNVQYNKHP